MRYALMACIHSNLEAFRATLQDIEKQQIDKICILGDLVGYGPNPVECVDLAISLRNKGKLEVCLSGNHDLAAIFGAEGFNYMAQDAIEWTGDCLERSGPGTQDRWDFLAEITQPQSRFFQKDELLFVHGSPRNPLNEYVFEEDVVDFRKIGDIFSYVSKKFSAKYCFMGHTHVPGVFVNNKDGGRYEYHSPKDIQDCFNGKFKLGSEMLLVNVGSVGQPGDGDPRSCYVILNYESGGSANFIEFKRVEYDVNKTVAEFEKVRRTDDRLHPFLSEVIKEGRSPESICEFAEENDEGSAPSVDLEDEESEPFETSLGFEEFETSLDFDSDSDQAEDSEEERTDCCCNWFLSLVKRAFSLFGK